VKRDAGVGCLIVVGVGIFAASASLQEAQYGALVVAAIAVWIALSRRGVANSQLEETNHRIDALHKILFELKDQVADLKRRGPVVVAAAPPPAAPAPAAPPPESAPDRQEPAPETTAVAPPPPPEPEPTTPEPPPTPQQPLEPRPAPPLPPVFAASAAEQTPPRNWLDFEEVFGANWLNKLGVVIFVTGIALFLAYEMRSLGAAGKILIGYGVSASLLGVGVFFERNDRWRILARAGIAGGWALTFFTTYAMYHVPAARVIQSQAADLVLLLGVAAVMVAHSLRYRSQITTGLAFAMAFSTLIVSQVNVYSLWAGAILVAGLAIVVARFAWYEMEVFGILAAYLNHWYWLSKIIEPMRGHKHAFPEFYASAALLIFYWAVFRATYVLRSPGLRDNPTAIDGEQVSTVAALLNSFFLLGILKYQSVHPEWAFWALLALGAAELALAQIPRLRDRRTAFLILSTIGVVLMMAAIPFRYSGNRLSVIWIFEAEAFLVAGMISGEVLFRYLGAIGGLAAAAQMIAIDASGVMGRRWDGADTTPDWHAALSFLIAAAVFYMNAHVLPERHPEKFGQTWEKETALRVSYLASIMLWIAAWIVFPEQWTAVAWAVLACVLVTVPRVISAENVHVPLRVQGNLIAAAVLVRLVSVNIWDPHHRAISVAFAAIALYFLARWSGLTDLVELGFETRLDVSQVYAWAASLALADLAWLELNSAAVVLAWIVLALVLAEWGFAARQFSLRLQAMLAFAAAFFRLFFVNLNVASTPGELSPLVYTVVPVALAFWYAYWRWDDAVGEDFSLDAKLHVQRILGFLGTMTLVALIRFEIAPDWVAAFWMLLVVALLLTALATGRRYFVNQALLVALFVFSRAAFYNLYERSFFPASFWYSRWVSVGACLVLFGVALALGFRLRIREAPETPAALAVFRWLAAVGRRPEQVFFFLLLVLLTALLEAESSRGMVTLAWGVEAVAVFLFALRVRERSFRLAGLALLLMAVGKIVFFDVWGLNPRDRYLTFIALGAALLLVSWLYTRFRETVRQYL